MQLKTEKYRGIAIKVVRNILSNGKLQVSAKFIYKGKTYNVKGDTKDAVIARAERVIDNILRK